MGGREQPLQMDSGGQLLSVASSVCFGSGRISRLRYAVAGRAAIDPAEGIRVNVTEIV